MDRCILLTGPGTYNVVRVCAGRPIRRESGVLEETFGITFSRQERYVPFEGFSGQAAGELFADIASLLHKNAALIDECLKEVLLLRSQMAEMTGDIAQTLRYLNNSLVIDPDQADVVDRMRKLQLTAAEPS